MDKDTIAIIISIASFMLSFFGIWLNDRNRKQDLRRASKIREEDLCNVEKQLDHLKSQSETAKEHVSILWEEKQTRDLGPKLQATIKETPRAYRTDKGLLINISVIIKNPTKRVIKVNNFRIPHESPFAFVHGTSFLSSTVACLIPEDEKCMDFNSTSPADLESQDICDCFNLKGDKEISFTFTVRHLKPDIESVVVFIIEHTSSNHPEKVLETKCWSEFLLPFEE
ncbi:hypothetical protein ME1_00783 [Bartonella vinsonii subsp. arupensis OK-94-513]|uniref:Uncharacterized protein n=1 Tax=Bartonella vinsonii subsp. arupensis OK-94-513 TaxID=1094562 RepID=J1JUW4_BARVI|nr:hypothetical protein [Bartonella vinsonii]EJF88325.1 hypothetical protein ME1_00783 [Bartonella vinsonii subsp. arupensis OK-94-513]